MNDQPNYTETPLTNTMPLLHDWGQSRVSAHAYNVASSTGLAVASVLGTFSYVRPILIERPLLGLFGFDLAPYTGLTSIIVLVALNLINRNTWKSKYDQELETSKGLRLTVDDLIKKNEYFMRENAYLQEVLKERRAT